MAFNTGDGSSGNPYIIETVANWNTDIGNVASGSNFKLGADIDFAGGSADVLENGNIVEGDGFELQNIGNFRRSGAEDQNFIRGATFNNGKINCDVTRSSGDLYIHFGDSGTFIGNTITGSLTNSGTGEVATVNNLNANFTMTDNISFLDLSGNGIVAGFLAGTVQVSTAERNIFAGTLTNLGTATLYGFSAETTSGVSFDGSYWDTDTTGVTNNVGGATGKTTAELQSIATYNDTATDGLAVAYSIEPFSTHTTETWGIDTQTASYPVLSYDVVAPSEPLVNVTIDSVAEAGADVILLQFDDKNLLNPVVIDKGVTDGSGNYTYTGGINTAKVFGYVVNVPDGADASLAQGAFRLASLNVT